MPIDVETLESQGREVSEQRNKHAQKEVLAFMRMKNNKGKAFMQAEVAAEVGMKPQQVRQIMFALAKKNIVTRKEVSYVNKAGKEEDGIFWRLI